MTKIYFVRHGEALGNKNFTFQGVTDNPLTPKGIEQGKLLGERFANVPYDIIYTSPLCRAADTAKLLNEAQKKPLVPDPAFLEVGGGSLEDVSMFDIHAKFPQHMHVWDNEPYRFVGPLMDEGVPEAFARLQKALRRLARNHKDGTVIIVAHGFMLRMFNCIASGLPLERIGEIGWGDNTCVSCVEFDENLQSNIVYINDASHVKQGMETPDFWVIKKQLEEERAKKEQV